MSAESTWHAWYTAFDRCSQHGMSFAIICALGLEAKAVRALLQTSPAPFSHRPRQSHNPAVYTCGYLAELPIVLVTLEECQMGQNSAATTATHLLNTFPQTRQLLLCGIAGALVRPGDNQFDGPRDLRLGDVVYSKVSSKGTHAFQQVDFGKNHPSGFQCSLQIQSRCSPKIANIVRHLEIEAEMSASTLGHALLAAADANYATLPEPLQRMFAAPATALTDILYPEDYEHSRAMQDRSCEEAQCDPARQLERTPRNPPSLPRLFGGLIASSNSVVKSAGMRRTLIEQTGGLCCEMETAAIAFVASCGTLDWFGIRGICDYADSHKHKVWQSRAAFMAASTLKMVLMEFAKSTPDLVQSQHTSSIRPATSPPSDSSNAAAAAAAAASSSPHIHNNVGNSNSGPVYQSGGSIHVNNHYPSQRRTPRQETTAAQHGEQAALFRRELMLGAGTTTFWFKPGVTGAILKMEKRAKVSHYLDLAFNQRVDGHYTTNINALSHTGLIYEIGQKTVYNHLRKHLVYHPNESARVPLPGIKQSDKY